MGVVGGVMLWGVMLWGVVLWGVMLWGVMLWQCCLINCSCDRRERSCFCTFSVFCARLCFLSRPPRQWP